MNMREEPNKPNSLYDTSSSHPLLANLPYPSSSLSSPIEENASDSAPYLHISYNHGPRSFNDLPFLFLFILFSPPLLSASKLSSTRIPTTPLSLPSPSTPTPPLVLNGKVVPKHLHGGEYDCVWKEDSWVPAYFALAILTMLWSATAMKEAQVYVISGTVGHWYFTKEDETRRNAFGPSSGTVCLSGLLVSVVRMVRSAVDNARREDDTGIVNLVLRCCVNALLAAFDFLNKFTINFAAITGEAYCSSAMMTYELLRRNLLSAVFVETISSRLLAGIVFVISAIYTIVVCAILNGVTNPWSDSYFVAALAWLLLILVLGFLVHVLDIVIDTIYVCYAINRDRGEVCKQDVHEVYVNLPISRNLRQPITRNTLGV
ncbi:hypothetical protein Lal_00019375 [Lupinus albus]|nr:hypothetical protein Lal_00019375 [Lupinus albus]